METLPSQSAANPASLLGAGFRLFAEPCDGRAPEPLAVPSGLTRLSLASRAAELMACPGQQAGCLLLEPVRAGHRQRLLLLVPDGAGLRVNDRLAPPLALLREGDRLGIGAAPALEVGFHAAPVIGPPAPESVGRQCPVCRGNVEASTRIYHCPCGTPLHLEEGPDHEARKCALVVGHCPSCGQATRLTPGCARQPWLEI